MISSALLAWSIVALLMVGAVAAGALCAVACSSVALRRAQRLLLAMAAILWLAAGWSAAVTLVLAVDEPLDRLARALLAIAVVLVALSPIRDVVTALSFALGGPHRLGDWVRTQGRDGSVEGRIMRLGLRSVVLSGADDVEILVPNCLFAAHVVHRLAAGSDAGAGAVMTLELPFRTGRDPEDACRELLGAAMLSVYAAPGRAAKVDVVADEHGVLGLRLRGFVCDRALAGVYRADILLRLEGSGAFRAGQPATPEHEASV